MTEQPSPPVRTTKAMSPRALGWLVGVATAFGIAVAVIAVGMNAAMPPPGTVEQVNWPAIVLLLSSPFIGVLVGILTTRSARRRDPVDPATPEHSRVNAESERSPDRS